MVAIHHLSVVYIVFVCIVYRCEIHIKLEIILEKWMRRGLNIYNIIWIKVIHYNFWGFTVAWFTKQNYPYQKQTYHYHRKLPKTSTPIKTKTTATKKIPLPKTKLLKHASLLKTNLPKTKLLKTNLLLLKVKLSKI